MAKPELKWAEFASECCTTWGSFGYLCSALCQWYEAVNKHPVEEVSMYKTRSIHIAPADFSADIQRARRYEVVAGPSSLIY